MDVVKGCELLLRRVSGGSARHPRADLYLPGLNVLHEEGRSLCTKADKAGDGWLHHRLLLLLSEVDLIEGELEGRE
ncbi:MAG: hypothetical protein E6Q97_23305 [Desulfurellales bacterium]|nr:MAG: hypothetical protein E6Q97_23305 [Desulfurellales bacterium]